MLDRAHEAPDLVFGAILQVHQQATLLLQSRILHGGVAPAPGTATSSDLVAAGWLELGVKSLVERLGLLPDEVLV